MDRTNDGLSSGSALNHGAHEMPLTVSAVSWGAILAGAAGAASLSLILLVLGAGLGLSNTSPWSREGMSAVSFGISAILWISFTQLMASGVGGYLAGRLRTRWTDTHVDEVFFRDTAHGFLAWGVATLLTAALISSLGMTIGKGEKAAPNDVANMAPAENKPHHETFADANAYFIDSLFRPEKGSKPSGDAPHVDSEEVGRIFANSMRTGALPKWDKEYLTQLVAARADVTTEEAEKRVNEVQDKLSARDVALKASIDKARKSSAYASLWFFISLLAGAFVASYLATFGGRLRDQ